MTKKQENSLCIQLKPENIIKINLYIQIDKNKM